MDSFLVYMLVLILHIIVVCNCILSNISFISSDASASLKKWEKGLKEIPTVTWSRLQF